MKINNHVLPLKVAERNLARTMSLVGFVALSALLAFAWTGKPAVGAATAAYGLFLGGLWNRKRVEIHMEFMKTAMLVDLGIVLALQIQKDAVGTVLHKTMSVVQTGHVGASTIALCLYLPVVLIGRRLFQKPEPQLRKWHLRIGMTTFGFRSVGFVLMVANQLF